MSISISGKSQGGTDFLGRLLRESLHEVSEDGVLEVTIRKGDAQKEVINKLITDVDLLEAVTGYKIPVRATVERTVESYLEDILDKLDK